MKSGHSAVFFLLLVLSLMGSCDHRPILYAYQPVNLQGWDCTDTLRFSLPDSLPAGPHRVSVGIRGTEKLAYRELWLVVEQRTGTNYRHRDTVRMELTDSKGLWLTQGNILHEMEVEAGHITPGAQPPTELLVYHLMQCQQLEGLTDVGVKVE